MIGIGYLPWYYRAGVTEEAAAASVLIAMRIAAFPFTPTPAPVAPQYTRFPYQSAAPAAANPVPAYRYGRDLSVREVPWVTPTRTVVRSVPAHAPVAWRIVSLPPDRPAPPVTSGYQRFPYQPPVQAPANPVLQIRVGRAPIPVPAAWVPAQYQRFPFVSAAAPPAASPIIGIRVGRAILPLPTGIPESQYLAFPYRPAAANPVIVYRFGRVPLPDVAALVSAQRFRFPYYAIIVPAVALPLQVEDRSGFLIGLLDQSTKRYLVGEQSSPKLASEDTT